MSEIRINVFAGNVVEKIKNDNLDFVISPHGYVMVKEEYDELDSLQKAFDLLNWSCYSSERSINDFSDIDHCGSGIILNIDDSNHFYLSLSIGWKKFDTFIELYEWYKTRWNNPAAMFKDKEVE